MGNPQLSASISLLKVDGYSCDVIFEVIKVYCNLARSTKLTTKHNYELNYLVLRVQTTSHPPRPSPLQPPPHTSLPLAMPLETAIRWSTSPLSNGLLHLPGLERDPFYIASFLVTESCPHLPELLCVCVDVWQLIQVCRSAVLPVKKICCKRDIMYNNKH